eukprot:8164852-Heterocapsa_arctica.AAC.1
MRDIMTPLVQHDQWQNATTGQTNERTELGTVGMYLATGQTWNDLRILTHHRSQALKYGGTIATPGGAMDRADYQHGAGWAHTEESFDHAARQA